MTSHEVANRLVELCKQFKNFDAMQELYAEDIVSVEAMPNAAGAKETKGKEAVIGKSAAWAAQHEIHSASAEGPYLAGDRFAVVFQFAVTPKATGQRLELQEVAVYTVAGGKIVKEEFFYGAHPAAFVR